jgi:hypothetical protein
LDPEATIRSENRRKAYEWYEMIGEDMCETKEENKINVLRQ